MKTKPLILAIIGMAMLSVAQADDLPFPVFNPTKSKTLPKNDVSAEILTLVAHLREEKESNFIVSGDATKALKWRVGHMNILSANVVAVVFDEGHVDVIGIYVRNYKDRAWELKAEINGTFKVRSFSDDSLKTTK